MRLKTILNKIDKHYKWLMISTSISDHELLQTIDVENNCNMCWKAEILASHDNKALRKMYPVNFITSILITLTTAMVFFRLLMVI